MTMARAFLAALLLMPLAGCAQQTGPTVTLKDTTYSVEIADDDAERQRGMMFRRELAADHGMLFLFPTSAPQAFWMRNCYIALDILYFDADGKFINGHYNVPPCNSNQCPSYASEKPARYVLELGGNIARELKLVPGDVLTLPR
jgi:uncharacterized protein